MPLLECGLAASAALGSWNPPLRPTLNKVVFMKLLNKLALTAAIALGSIAAHATTYDFSYTFDPSYANDLTNNNELLVVTGSFSATASGASFSNISNVQLAMNGPAVSGPLLIESLDANGNFSSSIAPTFSANVAQNDFVIADTDVSTGAGQANVSNYFYIDGALAPTAASGGQVYGINFNQTDVNGNFVQGIDLAANSANWTFSAVTQPVPEPETYAMLLAGLSLMAAVARRRTRG